MDIEDDGYIPNTAEVRNNFAFAVVMSALAQDEQQPDEELAAMMHDVDWPSPGWREWIKTEKFDVWLKQIQADAWREGFYTYPAQPYGSRATNPYTGERA